MSERTYPREDPNWQGFYDSLTHIQSESLRRSVADQMVRTSWWATVTSAPSPGQPAEEDAGTIERGEEPQANNSPGTLRYNSGDGSPEAQEEERAQAAYDAATSPEGSTQPAPTPSPNQDGPEEVQRSGTSSATAAEAAAPPPAPPPETTETRPEETNRTATDPTATGDTIKGPTMEANTAAPASALPETVERDEFLDSITEDPPPLYSELSEVERANLNKEIAGRSPGPDRLEESSIERNALAAQKSRDDFAAKEAKAEADAQELISKDETSAAEFALKEAAAQDRLAKILDPTLITKENERKERKALEEEKRKKRQDLIDKAQEEVDAAERKNSGRAARKYIPTYYSGTQAQIFFGDILIDEVNYFQYATVTNRTPIYGYASEEFDLVARGNKIIQGSFSINFVEANYLQIISQAMQESISFKEKGLGTRLPADVDLDSDLNSTLRNNSELNGSSFLGRQAVNQVKDIGNTEFRAYAKSLGLNRLKTDGTIDTMGNKFENIPKFDIYMVLGDYTDPDADHTVRIIRDVYLIGQGQTVAANGEPIAETYSFIGKYIE